MASHASTFRFQILNPDSVSAFTTVAATTQADAMQTLQRQLPRWQTAVPLHGPNLSRRGFWAP
jgi:hypothetical protein